MSSQCQTVNTQNDLLARAVQVLCVKMNSLLHMGLNNKPSYFEGNCKLAFLKKNCYFLLLFLNMFTQG